MKSFTLTKALVMILLSLTMISLELAAQLQFQVGTSTSSSTAYGPIYRSSATNAFDASRYSHLYTADEMAGLDSGSTITHVAWYKTTSSQTLFDASFTVYMENNADSVLIPGTSWASTIAPGTSVFTSATFQIGDSTGWIMVPVTPFVYTGGALQISMEWDISGTPLDPTDGAFNWRYSTTPNLRTIGNFAAVLAPTLDVPDPSNPNRRPNVLFTYSPPPSDDAGVIQITSIPSSQGNGLVNIDAIFTNFGGSPVTGVTLYALVDDGVSPVLVGPAVYTGPTIGIGGISDTINIGTATLTNSAYTICAWTSLPNGVVDDEFSNDTTCVSTFACDPLSGAFTIDQTGITSGTNFASFTDAATILQTCGIDGAITISVLNGPYEEQVTFGTIPGSNSTNTVTINGNNEVITYGPLDNGSNFSVSGNQHIIRLNGTDHFTIDNLQILFDNVDTLVQECWAVHILGTSGNPCDSVTISNCNIVVDTAANQVSSDDQFNGIIVSGSATSLFTDGYGTGLTVDGNTIFGGYYGFRFDANFSGVSTNLTVTNNDISYFSSYGTYCLNVNSPLTLSGNNIYNQIVNTFAYGMYFSGCDGQLTVTKNAVSNVYTYGVAFFGCEAIGPNYSLVANNCIQSGRRADGLVNTGTVYTMYLSSIDSANIWFNSTLCVGTSPTSGHGMIMFTGSAGNSVMGNSFANSGGGVGAEFDFSSNASINHVRDLNFNNYYSSGSVTVEYGNPIMQYTTQAGLASNPQGPAGHDLNSRMGDPGYVSDTDLHGTTAQLNSGTGLAFFPGITDDIDGDVRGPLTDLGCDEFTPPANQVGVVAVSGVESDCDLSATASISMEIKNLGSNALLIGDTIPVCYSINGAAAVSEDYVLTVNVGPSAVFSYTFTTTANLSADSVYVISAYTKLDTITSNDTATLTVENQTGLTMPLLEDFETWTANTSAFGTVTNVSNGWSSTPEGAVNPTYRWLAWDGPSPNFGTGPCVDNTTGTASGVYLVTDAQFGSAQTGVATLVTPCIVVSGTEPAMEYYYHKYGDAMGDLYVDIRLNGAWILGVDSLIGQQTFDAANLSCSNAPWQQRIIDLDAYLGSTIKVRFRAIENFGTSDDDGDIAIDDVRWFDEAAPEVGVVSVDLPVSGENCDLSTTEQICVTLVNNSGFPQTGFSVSAQVSGAAAIGPATFTVTDTVPAFGTATYCFPVLVDLSAVGIYTICVWTGAVGDPDNSNDTSCIEVDNALSPAPPISQTGDTVGPYNGTPLSGTISAVSSALGVLWYDSATGGNLIGNGDTLVTPPVSGKTTFYASSTTGTPICGPGTGAHVVQILATGSFSTEINWAITDTLGNIVAESDCGPPGPYAFLPSGSDTVCLDTGKAFIFQAIDDFGDGWNGANAILTDVQDNTLITVNNPSNGTLGGTTAIDCIGDVEATYEFTASSGTFGRVKVRCESPGRIPVCVFVDTIGKDIGVISIDNPVSQCANTATESVTVTIQNFGDEDQTGFLVCFEVDTLGSQMDSVCETYAGVLGAGTTVSYTFGTTLDVSSSAFNYVFSAYTDLAMDFDSTNDATASVVNTIGTSYTSPYTENFDALSDNQAGNLANGWNAQGTGSWRWQTNIGTTPSNPTGPLGDNTTGSGVYMQVETSSQQPGQERSLTSPCIDIGGGQPAMSYWYHAFGANMGHLYIDVQSGGVWNMGVDTVFKGAVQTSNGDDYIQNILDLSAYINESIQVRFRYRAFFGCCTGDAALDDIGFFDASQVDIGVASIDAPGNACTLGSDENITATVFNNSGLSGSGIDITYLITGPINAGPVTETIAATLPAFGNLSYTSTAQFNMSTPGVYTVCAWTSLGIDVDPSNDTACQVIIVDTAVLATPYVENFESFTVADIGPDYSNGWTGSTTGFVVPRWETEDASGFNENSGSTGPFYDATLFPNAGGVYFYMETSGGPIGGSASVSSPCIDLTNLANPSLVFAYHMYGADMGKLFVDVNVTGVWVEGVDSIIGQQQTAGSDPWINRVVSLVDYAGQTVRVRFRGVETTTGFTSDMSIDDVRLVDVTIPDAAAKTIDGPAPDCQLSTAEAVTATFRNDGFIPLIAGSAVVSYSVAGPTGPQGPFSDTIPDTLIAQTDLTLTFSDSADFSASGLYTITATISYPGDANAANNTVVGTVRTAYVAPYTQNFDSFTVGTSTFTTSGTPLEEDWTRLPDGLTNGTFTWVAANDVQPFTTTNTGPDVDHTTGGPNGVYLFTESSNGTGTIARLFSPCIDLSTLVSPTIEFYYHAFGSSIGELHLDLVTDTGIILDIMTPIIGQQQTSETAPWGKVLADISPWAGNIIQVRIRVIKSGTLGDLAVDDFRIFDGNAPDVAATALKNPTDSCQLSATETVTIQVSNASLVPLSNITIAYLIDNGGATQGPFIQVFPGPLAGATDTCLSFTTTADFSAPGVYTVTALATVAGDVDAGNDTLFATVQTSLPAPVTETFEGFAQGNLGNTFENGWTSSPNTSVPRWETEDAAGVEENSFGTGPWFDHTNFMDTIGTGIGMHFYLETSGGGSGDSAMLISPCISLATVTIPVATFWYHMWGPNMGDLSLDINDGSGWTNLITISGEQHFAGTDPWSQALVPLAGYAGATVQFRFVGTNGPPDGSVSTFTSDMAVDDFNVSDFALQPADLAVVEVLEPKTGCALGASEPVCVVLQNLGGQTITTFFITGFVGGPINSGPATLPAVVILPPLSIDTFCFPFTANLSAPGTYTTTVSVNLTGDPNSANDTASSVAINIPEVTLFPYNESFENGAGGWNSGGTNSTWDLGTPNLSVIQGASNGSEAWSTAGGDTSFVSLNGANGVYNNNEQSWVESPCFDMSTLPTAEIIMDVWWNSEFSWDGANLQSTIDGGNTWTNVGALGDPDNWYTDGTINGAPGGSQQGWSGRASSGNGSGGWVTARHALNFLPGEPEVRLRVNFGSDGSVQDNGFAFDNILIREIPPIDAGVVSIVAPADGCGLTSTETVVLEISNFGVNTIVAPSEIPVGYLLNDDTIPVLDTITLVTNLAAGGTESYTLNVTIDLGVPGDYNITAFTNIDADGNNTNDTTTTEVTSLLIPDPPTVISDTVCGDSGVARVYASGNGDSYLWYDSATGGNLLGQGDSFDIAVSGVTTIYCEASTEGSEFVGPVDNTIGGGGIANFTAGIFMDVVQQSTLISAYCYPSGAGNRVVNVFDDLGNLFSTTTVFMDVEGRYTLNLDLPAGNGIMVQGVAPNLFRNSSGVSYPYVSPGGNVTINNSTAGASFYYFFYDIEIGSIGCTSSSRTAATISTSPVITTSIVGTDVTTAGGNDGSADLTVGGGTPPYSFLWSNGAMTEDINTLVAGTYDVTVTDAVGCTAVDQVIINQPAGCDPGASVTGITTFDIRLTRARLDWDDLPATDHYEVRGKRIAPVVDPNNTELTIPGTQSIILATGLNAGTTYQWEVRAVCNAAGTIFTPWSGLTTFVTGECENPGGTNTHTIMTDRATLDWNPIAYPFVVGYRVIGGTLGNFNVTLDIGNPAVTQLVATQLPSATTFNWGVIAACQDGPGVIVFSPAASAPINVFTTLGAASKVDGNVQPFGEEGMLVDVFPNPANQIVNVMLSGTTEGQELTVSIFDISGKEVITEAITAEDLATTLRLDVSELANGYYKVVTTGDDVHIVNKVIVSNN